MVYKLNILHLLILLDAAVLRRDARGRVLHPSRLFAAPLLASVAALGELSLITVVLTAIDSETTLFEVLTAAAGYPRRPRAGALSAHRSRAADRPGEGAAVGAARPA